MNAAEKIMAMTKKLATHVVSIVDDDKSVRDALGNLLESVVYGWRRSLRGRIRKL